MESIAAKPQIHEHSLKGLLFLLALSFSFLFSPAQEQRTAPSKKAVKLFEKALESYRLGDLANTEEYLSGTLTADPGFADAWILRGDLSIEQDDPENAIAAYRKALSLEPERPGVVRELLARALFNAEQYGEAAREYELLLISPDLRPELKRTFAGYEEIASFRQSLIDNPVSFRPKNPGAAINTGNDEYVNALGAESDQLIFTRKVPVTGDPLQREFREDFYQSMLSDTGWTLAALHGFSQSYPGDAGGLSLSADGNLLFFTACFRSDSRGSCDLYYSEKKNGQWSEPKNLGETVYSDNWDAQPSVSSDGRTLYFASNREGSLGSSDIWKTRRMPDGSWTKPVNLGPSVNTADTEMAPYIHFDNRTLYFSSRGHMGMGGHDLFLSREEDGNWTSPVNIGYPVNTGADELILVVSPDGTQAFSSAMMDGGYGGYDIYSFALPEEARALAVTYLKGRVYDAETGRPLAAQFELIALPADSLAVRSSSAKDDGSFLVCVPVGSRYALNVSRPGYLFYSGHLELDVAYEQADPYLKDIPLQPVKAGSTIILRNIFYETDRYLLKEGSKTELNKLVDLLRQNPGLHVEISGHTDNVGTEEYNLELSRNRAEAVTEYLESQGISPERIIAKGYGYREPVADNDTPEGRAENRRTELKVLRLE